MLLSFKNNRRVESTYKWQLVENDPDDNKFVDCTIAASADYLVTNDNDILQLRTIPDLFPQLTIITFEKFREILEV